MKEIMALCIGGPLDGRTRVMGSSPVLHAPIPPRLSIMNFRPGEARTTENIHHAVYEKEVFTADGKRFYFWRLAGMSASEMVRQLVAGYKPANL